MLSGQTAAIRAHLRSHSGRNAGVAFAHAQIAPEYVSPLYIFRVLLLERLRLPPPITEATCGGCGAPPDPRGIHRATCTSSGRVRKRAAPVERMLARVFREAGARVRFNAFLRDMNVGVAASDARRIDKLAQDLPCFGGSQLAVDVILRIVLGYFGEPQQEAADIDGAILLQARRDKESTYPELVASDRCRFVVVALEPGGRWSEEASDIFRQLAFARARRGGESFWRGNDDGLACWRQLVRCLLQHHLCLFQKSVRHGAALAGKRPP